MPIADEALLTRYYASQGVARTAGRIALAYFRDYGRLAVERKGPQDVVSVADREVERAIRRKLAQLFPQDALLGEEGGRVGPADARFLWVVDPIDGTQPFLAGIPAWCVSIAALDRGVPMLGVIYDPNADELFCACAGLGALVDGVPAIASTATSLSTGMVGVGYSTRTPPAPCLAFLEALLTAGGMFVRNGSGALMIAYAATGRLLGYFEAHINAWDCLAGLVLARETGCWTNDFLADEGLARGNLIAIASPGVTDEFRSIITATGALTKKRLCT
jgi:myo-inositol-1(or 4)-monophosphatase